VVFVAFLVINVLSVSVWCITQMATNRVLLDVRIQHSLLWKTVLPAYCRQCVGL